MDPCCEEGIPHRDILLVCFRIVMTSARRFGPKNDRLAIGTTITNRDIVRVITCYSTKYSIMTHIIIMKTKG
jgi:hypothetical protein